MYHRLKIKKQLLEQEKISYASDHIDLPEGGIDCSEGCNPYGFPPECADVVKSFDASRLGPYPHSQAFYEAIMDYWKDSCNIERHNLIITDGSINALYIINNIFDTHDAVALGISPQFTDYYMHASMLGIEYEPYQLRKDRNFKFDADEFIDMHYEEEADTSPAACSDVEKSYNFIYIDNPNNPTGQCIDIGDIERIVAEAVKFDITVIIDEAYGDFMPKENSAIGLCEKYSNLVVVRTMSKGFGLAGMRAGYIVACRELIHCMNKMLNPYMVGELTREVAAEALRHADFIERCKADFASMKKRLRKELGCTPERPEGTSGKLHLAETLDTNSLFLLYHEDPEIDLKKEFYKRGVLVVDGYDFKGLDSNSARVRLPKMDEFPMLLRAIIDINEL